MSKPLAFGLSFNKKAGSSKPPPPKRRAIFGDDDDGDDEKRTANTRNGEGDYESFEGDFTDLPSSKAESQLPSRTSRKANAAAPKEPPKLKKGAAAGVSAMFGDLSGALASRKNAEAATDLDSNVYEYDAVYESLKPQKKPTEEDKERRPKYMQGLMKAAEVRKRDALIAEEKKIAREREDEGKEFEGKEKFVTEAYKKQQEDNKRIEEEERRREEKEAKENQGGGMSSFYRKLLNKDEERHADVMKAAEQSATHDTIQRDDADGDKSSGGKDKSQADFVKELKDKGAEVAVNEDGQVVDKRQLLRGGLNVGSKKKDKVQNTAEQPKERSRLPATGQQIGQKQAMRERQSRMLAEQLEQSMKRSREDSQQQRDETERAAKSQKTDGDISSAKERYLARKRAAEEAKKHGGEPI